MEEMHRPKYGGEVWHVLLGRANLSAHQCLRQHRSSSNLLVQSFYNLICSPHLPSRQWGGETEDFPPSNHEFSLSGDQPPTRNYLGVTLE